MESATSPTRVLLRRLAVIGGFGAAAYIGCSLIGSATAHADTTPQTPILGSVTDSVTTVAKSVVPAPHSAPQTHNAGSTAASSQRSASSGAAGQHSTSHETGAVNQVLVATKNAATQQAGTHSHGGSQPGSATSVVPPVATAVVKPVTQAAAPVAKTVTQVATPVTKTVTQVAAPVTKTVDQVAAPVTKTVVAPVTQTVATVVAPVTQTVTHVVAPATQTVTHVVAPVTQTVTQITDPVAGVVGDPGRTVTSAPETAPKHSAGTHRTLTDRPWTPGQLQVTAPSATAVQTGVQCDSTDAASQRGADTGTHRDGRSVPSPAPSVPSAPTQPEPASVTGGGSTSSARGGSDAPASALPAWVPNPQSFSSWSVSAGHVGLKSWLAALGDERPD